MAPGRRGGVVGSFEAGCAFYGGVFRVMVIDNMKAGAAAAGSAAAGSAVVGSAAVSAVVIGVILLVEPLVPPPRKQRRRLDAELDRADAADTGPGSARWACSKLVAPVGRCPPPRGF